MPVSQANPFIHDGRKYPKFAMVYTEEIVTPEVQKLSDAGFRVWILLNLCLHQKEGERVYWCSYERIAGAIGRSRSTVYRKLDELRKAGLISSQSTQGANRITLHKPKSLMVAKKKAVQESQNCNSGDVTQGDTPGSSSCMTLLQKDTKTSTDVSASPNRLSLKERAIERNGWDGLYAGESTPFESQAITEEDCAEMCEQWRDLLELARGMAPEASEWEDLARLCRNQPEHFVQRMKVLINANEDLLRMMMKTPGFYQEMFKGSNGSRFVS